MRPPSTGSNMNWRQSAFSIDAPHACFRNYSSSAARAVKRATQDVREPEALEPEEVRLQPAERSPRGQGWCFVVRFVRAHRLESDQLGIACVNKRLCIRPP